MFDAIGTVRQVGGEWWIKRTEGKERDWERIPAPLLPGLGDWEIDLAFSEIKVVPARCCNKVGIFRSGARIMPHSDCVTASGGPSVRQIRDAEGMG